MTVEDVLFVDSVKKMSFVDFAFRDGVEDGSCKMFGVEVQKLVSRKKETGKK